MILATSTTVKKPPITPATPIWLAVIYIQEGV